MAEENKEQGAQQQPKQQPKPKAGGKIAAILIRNTVRAPGIVTDTLKRLKLHKKNSCTVLDNNPASLGMFKKVKDYITYGEIDLETLKALQDKRGKKDTEGKMLNTFSLNPPKGGYERKGVKKSITVGGALGYRRDKINQLIMKML